MSRRSHNVVTSQILNVCRNGASKTRVVYKVNLNSAIGTQYLNDLLESSLIEAIPDGSRFIYKTTSKGLELQEKLGQFQCLMDQLESDA